ncbi:MAG: hypothetical protein GF313_02625 [Caldithrix sp.]|nr:hypothetical protein [Caldithrix sp.]
MMQTLQINITELAFVLHRGPDMEMECYLNLDSGNIINIPTNRDVLSNILKFKDDIDRYDKHALIQKLIPENLKYLYIPDQLSQVLFPMMDQFIELIKNDEPSYHEKLWKAIHRYGDSKRFTRILKTNPKLFDHYLMFRDFYFEKEADKWLKKQGVLSHYTDRSERN